MDHDTFIRNIVTAEGTGGSVGDAETAARVTLELLGRRLEQGEAHDLAAQLPPELGDAVRTGAKKMEKLSVQDFLAEADRLTRFGDPVKTERYVRAVLGTLSEAVTRGELTDVFSQLPKEYNELFTARSV